MNNPETFWNWIAGRYARSPVADPETYERKLAQTRALLRPEMQLLDVGCGTGSTAIALAPHVAGVLAIDFSDRMLAIAQDKAAAAGVENVTFQNADLAALPVTPGCFDIVLAMNVLHLVADLDAALARLSTVLRPGGHLVGSTACLADGAAWLRPLAPLTRRVGMLPTLAVFTRATLEQRLAAAGLPVVDIWQPGKGKAVFSVSRKV